MATALLVVGTLATAVGQIQSLNAQADAAEFNAAVAERDAVVAQQNRELALQTSRVEQDDLRREQARDRAAVRAAFGASGVDLAGTPLDVLEDLSIGQELDVQRVGTEGQLRARELDFRSASLRENAQLSRAQARSARGSRALTFLGTTATGFGQALQRGGGSGEALAALGG